MPVEAHPVQVALGKANRSPGWVGMAEAVGRPWRVGGAVGASVAVDFDRTIQDLGIGHQYSTRTPH